MTLRARLLERRINRGVKTALRASGTLWGDFRQVRKRARQNLQLPGWMGRVIFLVWVFMMLQQAQRPVEVVAAIVCLWILGVIFLRASQFRTSLYFSPSLGVYKLLPIPDRDIFTLQWQEFLRRCGWSVLEFSVAYSVLASRRLQGANAIYLGVGLGLIQGLFVLASSICLYAYVRPTLFRLAALFFASAVALVIFGSTQISLGRTIIQLAFWLPPTGWVFQLLGLTGSTGGNWVDFVPVILGASVLALFPVAWKRARDFYVPTEDLLAAAERAGSANPTPTLQGIAEQAQEDPAEVESAIKSRLFLQPLDWGQMGLVERLVARILSPREKMVVEYLLAGGPQWTKGLRGLLILMIVLGLGWFLFKSALTSFLPIVIFVLVFLLSFAGQSTWRGFTLPRGSGLQSPFYALYPLGFWEIVQMVLKVNLTRLLILLPIMFVACGLAIWALHVDPVSILRPAFKLAWLGIVLQPFAVILPISTCSTDSQGGKFILAALPIGFGCIGSGLVLFLYDNTVALRVAAVLITLLPSLALYLYGIAFNRCCFDLVPIRANKNVIG